MMAKPWDNPYQYMPEEDQQRKMVEFMFQPQYNKYKEKFLVHKIYLVTGCVG